MDASTAELELIIRRLYDLALAQGLKPPPFRFEIVPPHVMDLLGAYLYPSRYSHWSFGKLYTRIRAARQSGSINLYEQVVNTVPCCVYVSTENNSLRNTVAIAHALAHGDFFQHNRFCQSQTSESTTIQGAALRRITDYAEKYGRSSVECVLDACIALQPHVDATIPIHDLRSLPTECTDLLGYIAAHAPQLAAWEKDILVTARTEMIYLHGQQQTKILNEGWAAYWHTKLIHELALPPSIMVQFAAMQVSLLRQASYLVGMRILQHLSGMVSSPRSTGYCGQSIQCLSKTYLFQVRTEEKDVSFLNKYLTESIADELVSKLYASEKIDDANLDAPYRTFLINKLLQPEPPKIIASEHDYQRCGELYLIHKHDGRNLDIPNAYGVLTLIASLWRRRVHLETYINKERVVLTAD